MTTDFLKHQKIIDSFRGEVNKPGFDTKFTESTQHLAKTETFLLKMELKRLATVCTRFIDLRGLVDGNCQLFEYNGQDHFLDDVAIKVFEENVEMYEGYTFGVYDAVKNTENNFRVMYQKEQQQARQSLAKVELAESDIKSADKIQYPVFIFPLNQYHDRIEERMNFVTSLAIVLENNQQKSVSSIDVSASGLKFRFNSNVPLYLEQKVSVIFKGLQEDFKFDENDMPVYQIKNIQRDANTQLVGCQRIDASDNDAFIKFLSGYIQGNKRRYKINLENTIATLQARIFEQYVLPKISELPIFFERTDKGIKPRYALTTNNNQRIFQYWQDEKNNSNLQYIINDERLARLLAKHKQGKTLLVYSFIHQSQGKGFFYTIDEAQLSKEDDFFPSFLSFAAKKNTFAVTQLAYIDINESSIYSPFSLSNTQELKKQYINLPPSPEVIDCIKSLAFSVVVSDITSQTAIEQYQHLSNVPIDVNKLKIFGHKRLKENSAVGTFGVIYKNQRQEHRFIYDTPAIVEYKNTAWQGATVDFSVSGVKILLAHSADIDVGKIVDVTFPGLQKITSAYDLVKLPYDVVRINKTKTVINLQVHVKDHQHIGRSFFKLLINKNKDKLSKDEPMSTVYGLGEALRTHYAQNMLIPTLVVQSSGSRYKVESLVSNEPSNKFLRQLIRLSDRKGYYNFYPLLTKLYKESFIESCLKKLTLNEKPITETLYIAIANKVEKIDKDVRVHFEQELNTPELRKYFIKKSLEKGHFFCFQITISRTNRPDIEYLNTELSYVNAYALHRSKQIEREIWSVVATIQYVDVTDEVLFSHSL